MTRALLVLPLLLGLATVGCGSSLVPFTHEIRAQHGLTDADLKNLQFYVSHRITLRRELESGGRQVTGNHKLLLVSGKTIEEVVVEEKTPGIVVAIGNGVLSISFEQGSSLEFTVAGSGDGGRVSSPRPAPGGFAEPPDPFPGNSPRRQPDPEPEPLAPSPDSLTGNYWLAVGPTGRLTYQGKLFEPVEETSQAHLLIDAESLEEVVESRKVLPGVRLPSR